MLVGERCVRSSDFARFFDVQGAATSPFDVAAGTDINGCGSATTICDHPSITPTGTGELVIATLGAWGRGSTRRHATRAPCRPACAA